MLRPQHHVGGTEERIRPRGKYPNDIVIASARRARGNLWSNTGLLPATLRSRLRLFARNDNEKINQRSFAFTNPIPLRNLNSLRPVNLFEIVQEPLGVGRDPEKPLLKLFFDDFRAAALALAINYLLISKHRQA